MNELAMIINSKTPKLVNRILYLNWKCHIRNWDNPAAILSAEAVEVVLVSPPRLDVVVVDLHFLLEGEVGQETEAAGAALVDRAAGAPPDEEAVVFRVVAVQLEEERGQLAGGREPLRVHERVRRGHARVVVRVRAHHDR